MCYSEGMDMTGVSVHLQKSSDHAQSSTFVLLVKASLFRRAGFVSIFFIYLRYQPVLCTFFLRIMLALSSYFLLF